MSDTNSPTAIIRELRDRVLVAHGGPTGTDKGWNLGEADSDLHRRAADLIETLCLHSTRETIRADSEWRKGALMAVSVQMASHDLPVVAADTLGELGLETADCSDLEEFDKGNLRRLVNEAGVKLTGLDAAPADQPQRQRAQPDEPERHSAAIRAKLLKKLTLTQSQMLARVPDTWQRMPFGIGCTNATLKALETRGIVDLSLERYVACGGSVWKWRVAPTRDEAVADA